MTLLGSPISIDKIRIVKIIKEKIEVTGIKSLFFKDKLCYDANPGQFLMVWVLGVDEVPMSLSSIAINNLSSITIAKIGDATNKLHSMTLGDRFGIRGPYGNGFKLIDGKALIVGGGIGLAPLMPLTKELIKKGVEFTLIAGAKTKATLPFKDTINTLQKNHEVCVTTDDGSYGTCGTTTDLVEDYLTKKRFDMVYTCGPENMMWKVFQIAEKCKTLVQASLERHIKCGLGLCGHCVIDPLGLRICKDGPVFSSEVLREATDFGKHSRIPNGRKIPIGKVKTFK